MLLRELSDNGQIIESRAFTDTIPDFYSISPTTCYTWWDIKLKTQRPMSDIQNIFLFVMDENDIVIEDISYQFKEGVALTLAEKPIGEILVEKGIVSPNDVEETLKEHKTTGEALVEKGKAPREVVEKMAYPQSQSRKIAKSATIRVDTDKLDKLVNLVGEMVISVCPDVTACQRGR
jgi:two-component system chemotaxis sensor kinase CheA